MYWSRGSQTNTLFMQAAMRQKPLSGLLAPSNRSDQGEMPEARSRRAGPRPVVGEQATRRPGDQANAEHL